MIQDEWKRMNLPMNWDIYKGECDESVPFGLTELDLTAGVPDGTYDVVSAVAEFPEEGRIGGVVVRNGQFDPKTTAEACYRAICVGCYGMGPRGARREATHTRPRAVPHQKRTRGAIRRWLRLVETRARRAAQPWNPQGCRVDALSSPWADLTKRAGTSRRSTPGPAGSA